MRSEVCFVGIDITSVTCVQIFSSGKHVERGLFVSCEMMRGIDHC